MGQWDLQANETSLYFKNTVNDKVVEDVQKALLSGKDTIYVSFDVIGRTCHQMLSYQLRTKLVSLYGPKVEVEIDYNYVCTVKWQTELGHKMAKEMTTGAGCDGCNGDGCNGGGCQFEHENNPEVEGTEEDFVYCMQDCDLCQNNVHNNADGDCHLIVVPNHGKYNIEDIDKAMKRR